MATEKEKQKRNNSVVAFNKDVLQSYILTTAKYDFNVYEKRILYRIVELAQEAVDGLNFRDGSGIRRVQFNLYNDADIVLPLSYFLGKGETISENYNRIRAGFVRLTGRVAQYEYTENGHHIWMAMSLIERPKITDHSVVEFRVPKEVWECCLDFTKGYRKYELITAMSFKSVYSMRFYELVSGQKNPIYLPLEGENGLREVFQLDYKDEKGKQHHKYKQINDIERKVILAAQKELDACSPYTFTYKPVTQNSDRKAGRGNPIVGFTFFPVYQHENRDQNLAERETQRWNGLPSKYMDKNLKNYLLHNLDFTDQEINNNYTLFYAAARIPDIIETLARLQGQARNKGLDIAGCKAYIVGTLQKICDEKGLVWRKKGVVSSQEPDSRQDIIDKMNELYIQFDPNKKK